MKPDPRKAAIVARIQNELTPEERDRLRRDIDRVCFDTFNYDAKTNTFCPLAVALNLHRTMLFPSNEKVIHQLSKRFQPVNIVKGTPGDFYTIRRKEDLLEILE